MRNKTETTKTFEVSIRRVVAEEAMITVEARDEDEARAMAQDDVDCGCLDWFADDPNDDVDMQVQELNT